MRLPTAPRKVRLALLAFALVGFSDLAQPAFPHVATTQGAIGPAGDVGAAAPSSAASVTVVPSVAASVIQYLDLVMRLVALLIAWFTKPAAADPAPATGATANAAARNGYR